jgi:hypothetical protein
VRVERYVTGHTATRTQRTQTPKGTTRPQGLGGGGAGGGGMDISSHNDQFNILLSYSLAYAQDVVFQYDNNDMLTNDTKTKAGE